MKAVRPFITQSLLRVLAWCALLDRTPFIGCLVRYAVYALKNMDIEMVG